MSKTLSTNVTNGKGGNSRPVFLIVLTTLAADVFRWAYPVTFIDTVVEPDVTYSGDRIKRGGLGNIESSIRLEDGGNVGTVGSFSLTLENSDLYSDTLLAYVLENATLEVRLIFSDQTLPSWANAVACWKGYVEDIEWDWSKITIKCVDAWTKRHRVLLNDDLITKEEYPNVADANVGNPVPIIYGDFWKPDVHKSHIPAVRLSAVAYSPHYDHVTAYRIDLMGITGYDSVDNLLLARHELNQYPDVLSATYGAKIRSYKAGGFLMLGSIAGTGGGIGTSSYAANRFIQTGAHTGDCAVFPVPIVLISATGTTTAANCINENTGDTTSLVNNQSFTVRLSVDDEEVIRQCATLYIFAQVDMQNQVDDRLKVLCYDEDDNLLSTVYTSVFTNNTIEIGAATITSLNNPANCYVVLSYDVVDTPDAGGIITIKNLHFRYTFSDLQDSDESYFMPCKGREYGSWIDDAAYSNSHNAGDLIETPIGIMESLLHDELGLATSDLDCVAFDALDVLRDSWKFARDLLDTAESLALIKSLAFEACLGYILDYEGKESVFRLDPIGTPTTLGNAVILQKSGQEVLKGEKAKLSTLRNEFYLHYKKNYATGDFEKLLFVKSPEAGSYAAGYTNLTSAQETYWTYCHNLYSNLGVHQVWEYNAEWIRDDATAELFIKFMIGWLTFNGTGLRYILKCTTALDTINLEVGDQQRFDHVLLPAALTDEHFILTKQVIKPDACEIDLEFLQIGTL